jgi:hypothetical protein
MIGSSSRLTLPYGGAALAGTFGVGPVRGEQRSVAGMVDGATSA